MVDFYGKLVGKYIIHGSYGIVLHVLPSLKLTAKAPEIGWLQDYIVSF